MRKALVNCLLDPNDQSSGEFELYAHEYMREGNALRNAQHFTLLDTDDVEIGYLINHNNRRVYPIVQGILSMLSDDDLDRDFYRTSLQQSLDNCPETHEPILSDRIVSLTDAEDQTDTGKWNQGEMSYYDADVDTPEKREAFLQKIRSQALWHIYIERKRHLIDHVPPSELTGRILEIGCGNARTISWICSPDTREYDYTGSDISFSRLLLAKMVIPQGDFVQASAINLPFQNETFSVVVAFGVLHHLPDPQLGIACSLEKIKPSGRLLFHEPIDKPSRVFDKGRLEFLRKKMEGYEHSEHDNELDLDAALQLLTERPVEIESLKTTVTGFRTIVVNVLMKLLPSLARSEAVWKALIATDDALAAVFCRRPNIFGPGAAFCVVRKSE